MKRYLLALLLVAAPVSAQTLGDLGLTTEKAPIAPIKTAVQIIAEKMAVSAVGDTLLRSGNREVVKTTAQEVTEKIYAAPQWDGEGKPLLAEVDGKLQRGECWVRFTPDAATAKLAVKVEQGNTLHKEEWTVPSATTGKLTWTVECSGDVTLTGGALEFADASGAVALTSPAPVAWDSKGKPVGVTVTLEKNVLGYALSYPKDCAFPVTVDPTVGVASGRDGSISKSDGTSYGNARDAASGTASAAYVSVGQSYAAPNYTVYRGFLSFPVGNINAVTSAKLYLNTNSDGSTTDFGIYLLGARSYKPTLTGADFINFNGRVSGGAHTGTILNDTWNSSGVAAGGGWNAFTLNAAGLDSLYAAKNDTLWLALTSKEDYDNSAPTNNEYIQFRTAASGIDFTPFLKFTYMPAAGYVDTTIIAGRDGYIRGGPLSGASYVANRDTTTGTAFTNTIAIGQNYATNYTLYRGFLSFVVPNITGNYSAAIINLKGNGDYSTTDLGIYVVGARSYRPTLAAADYRNFNGWTWGGAHTGAILNDTWNSSSFSGGYNTLTLNAAGLDSLNAAQGDTLWLALISKEDYDNSAPTNSEYIIFESSATAGAEPYLDLTYPLLSTPTVATLTADPVTYNSATLGGNLTDTGGENCTVRGIAWGLSANPDTSGSHLADYGDYGAGSFTQNLSGLTPGTLYHYRAFAANSTGLSWGADSTFTTLAVPTLTLLHPLTGDFLPAGSDTLITWSYTGTLDSLKIEYSLDGGGSWTVAKASRDADSDWLWTVPDVRTKQARVRITSTVDATVTSESGDFTIGKRYTLYARPPWLERRK